MHRIPFKTIEQFIRFAFDAAEVEPTVARQVTTALIQTSLRGVDSHGIRLAPHYVSAIRGGRLNPKPNMQFTKTAAATGVLDADHTLGHVAGYAAINHAIELAQQAGMGYVVVKNSSHCGALAPYVLKAAENDMIGMGSTNATPTVKAPNSSVPYYGTNPLCITAPMHDETPFCYDGASSVYTFNKIRLYRERDEPLPPGIGADKGGNETTNPHDVMQLLPMGGYKGFSLLMIADMMSAMLGGMPSGNDVTVMFGSDLGQRRYLGQFYAAIRLDAFIDPTEFKAALQHNAEKIRALPRTNPDEPIYIPGDPEKITEADRRANGIPVPDAHLEHFHVMATELGIKPLLS